MDVRAIEDAIRSACEGAPGLEAALLFGSAARGITAPRDVDVAFLWREDVPPFERLRRATLLATKIERALPPDRRVPVDAQDLRRLPLPVQHRALREGRRAHVADAAALVRFQTRTLSQALDQLPSYYRTLEAAARNARG